VGFRLTFPNFQPRILHGLGFRAFINPPWSGGDISPRTPPPLCRSFAVAWCKNHATFIFVQTHSHPMSWPGIYSDIQKCRERNPVEHPSIVVRNEVWHADRRGQLAASDLVSWPGDSRTGDSGDNPVRLGFSVSFYICMYKFLCDTHVARSTTCNHPLVYNFLSIELSLISPTGVSGYSLRIISSLEMKVLGWSKIFRGCGKTSRTGRCARHQPVASSELDP